MKQGASDAYNVAWFKLAECVARGEKERALGVYRLLAHSLNDKALAMQLEADILLAFSLDEALEKYQQAADCYAQTARLFKAACVYEHILVLVVGKRDYMNRCHERLVELYTVLKMDTKESEHRVALESIKL